MGPGGPLWAYIEGLAVFVYPPEGLYKSFDSKEVPTGDHNSKGFPRKTTDKGLEAQKVNLLKPLWARRAL